MEENRHLPKKLTDDSAGTCGGRICNPCNAWAKGGTGARALSPAPQGQMKYSSLRKSSKNVRIQKAGQKE